MNTNTLGPPSPEDDSDQPVDPFANIESLRLSQDFAAAANVRPVLTTVAVRKPGRQEFVRVRPGDDWRFPTKTYCQQDTREVYLVAQELWPNLADQITPTLLVVAMVKGSVVPFLWPLTLPRADGRSNRWNESAIGSALLAEKQWVRVVSDMSAGAYIPHVAQAELPDPSWPGTTLQELIKLAFAQRIIRDLDHPVLRQLRGEI